MSKRLMMAVLLGLLCGGAAWAEGLKAAWAPVRLRCEYLVNPLGIDAEKPRLSWVIEEGSQKPEARSQKQAAYQILVASSAELLKQDTGDLWDSQKVLSEQSSQVEYAGKPLASRTQCHWKVRVWVAALDAGKPKLEKAEGCAWSQPAFWEMGLLKNDEWTAQWIEGAGYVEKKTPAAPVALTLLNAVYGAEGAETNVTALLSGLVKNHCLSVKVDNTTFGGDPCFGKAKQLHVEYERGGKRLKKTVEENAMLAIPDDAGGAGADRLYYLRKTLKLADKPVAKARLFITALGLYEMTLNGQRVGDSVFAPEWTDYRKRIRYQVYDVTALLRKGDNVCAGLVGPGWYSGHIGLGGYKHYGQIPALLAQLEVTFADGTLERVVTDASWKVAGSPILASDFMKGENYDARLEVKGWNAPGTDDSAWMTATAREEVPRPLQSQVMEPVRKICELQAKAVTEPKPGCWTFDLGQNLVGYARLKVSAPAGTRLTLRHAEILNPDGTIYTKNLRSAVSVDTYTCKGGGAEIFQPHFTFHGFRYVELTGVTGKPAPDTLTGIVTASDTPRAGEFACSDPRINQLYSNICWGQRGNYLSIPTDCPQRDERLGWMGDAQVFVRTATYNADVAAFFTKWLVDVDDAQRNGAFTDISPGTGCGEGTPAWADAGVICPWTLYHVYGDVRLLEKHYPAMASWIEWCRAHSTGLIRNKDRGGDYGDWLSIGADTPKDLIGTAYFAYSTRLVAQAAKALGKADDAAKYEQLFQEIKAAFNTKYVAADGRIQGNTQCGYVMALKFDLLSDDLRAQAVRYLVEDITAKQDHLSTGFVGVSYLLPVLTQAGKLDTVFKLFLQDTFPSWLFSVKHGATTIWERWDGWTPDKGFQDPGMNSFNHYSLGSCGEWMFSSLAGIDTDGPGFRKLVIRPTPGAGITWVKASYESINGRIASSWRLETGSLKLEVTIPANTTATVYVPAADAAGVTESGKPAAQAAGVRFLRVENGAAVYAVGSGQYRFASALNKQPPSG
ncbi:MAG: family 78 glycoside hydrolase catalytic domain [bacterium]